ncbi:helix-turn-helix domain-containing protein [Bremerella sp. JC770]|uniref:helix-turn-helix domain-containing protein n=1 Tax=Bremerella sp. JC770 TaxID=3232137 RepID=UPI003459EB8F
MPLTKPNQEKLPGRFEDLVAWMPPRAITDESHYEETLEMVDRLMAVTKHTKGQAVYLETLVQLVEAYEAKHHAIETHDICGIDLLRNLLAENDMNASDLARLLGVHASMGSKLLKGDRSLTVDHLQKLAKRFQVRPELFMGKA